MEEEKRNLPARAQNIILEGRRKLSVSGVEEVLAFDDSSVVMRTPLGELNVHGEELKVENLAVDSGELTVTGHISAMMFTELPAGWWERLFG